MLQYSVPSFPDATQSYVHPPCAPQYSGHIILGFIGTTEIDLRLLIYSMFLCLSFVFYWPSSPLPSASALTLSLIKSSSKLQTTLHWSCPAILVSWRPMKHANCSNQDHMVHLTVIYETYNFHTKNKHQDTALWVYDRWQKWKKMIIPSEEWDNKTFHWILEYKITRAGVYLNQKGPLVA